MCVVAANGQEEESTAEDQQNNSLFAAYDFKIIIFYFLKANTMKTIKIACTEFHYMCILQSRIFYSHRPFIKYSCVGRNRSVAWAGHTFTSDCCENRRRSQSTESGATCRWRDCKPNWRNGDFPCGGLGATIIAIAFCCTIVHERESLHFTHQFALWMWKFSEINFIHFVTFSFLELCCRAAGILWLCVLSIYKRTVLETEIKAIFRGMKWQ